MVRSVVNWGKPYFETGVQSKNEVSIIIVEYKAVSDDAYIVLSLPIAKCFIWL